MQLKNVRVTRGQLIAQKLIVFIHQQIGGHVQRSVVLAHNNVSILSRLKRLGEGQRVRQLHNHVIAILKPVRRSIVSLLGLIGVHVQKSVAAEYRNVGLS
jgi:hypothetical protein